ncbi:iojap-like protein [Thalassoporum mexicanum PCC 7367]|uniref:ribosome silencing factor n=1 Tax=Thalassoporum mexicanum TaxID=3457544 RepID=UPI00029F942C|nr:ribosome silencing factor [Pseudanabaena sp. PCC 7367]AFY71856.1 iojap-like protein [Pseudanabaena sp. PCC 7367]
MTAESTKILELAQKFTPHIDHTAFQEDDSYRMALSAAAAADDRKGEDILILAVGEVSVLASYFLIITGYSRAQVRAIAESIKADLQDQYGVQPIRSSGQSEATWIVQDYGDLIIHVMQPTEREFYDLEAFWGHVPRFALSKSA